VAATVTNDLGEIGVGVEIVVYDERLRTDNCIGMLVRSLTSWICASGYWLRPEAMRQVNMACIVLWVWLFNGGGEGVGSCLGNMFRQVLAFSAQGILWHAQIVYKQVRSIGSRKISGDFWREIARNLWSRRIQVDKFDRTWKARKASSMPSH